jgi:hypothetical protein
MREDSFTGKDTSIIDKPQNNRKQQMKGKHICSQAKKDDRQVLLLLLLNPF